MIRDVDLISYLPPFLKEYKEINAALKAENPEFKLIWKAAERVLKNEFIETADESGIIRLEKIANLLPSLTMTLEERRAAVRMKWNQGAPYTIKKLQKELELHLDGEPYIMDTSKLVDYQLRIEVYNQRIPSLRLLKTLIKSMLPATIVLKFYGCYPGGWNVPIRYSNTIRFTMAFYPRYNLPRLHLNGTWMLDGSRKLSGYDGYEAIDFYPVCTRIQPGIRAVLSESIQVNFKHEVKEEAGNASSVLIRASTIGRPKTRESITIPMAFRQETAAGGITIHNENDLDGTWKLDGSRKLNGGSESR
jgi:hypothetical protein